MLAKVPEFTYVGPLGCAIVIAVIYRQFFWLSFQNKIRYNFLIENTFKISNHFIWSALKH